MMSVAPAAVLVGARVVVAVVSAVVVSDVFGIDVVVAVAGAAVRGSQSYLLPCYPPSLDLVVRR